LYTNFTFCFSFRARSPQTTAVGGLGTSCLRYGLCVPRTIKHSQHHCGKYRHVFKQITKKIILLARVWNFKPTSVSAAGAMHSE